MVRAMSRLSRSKVAARRCSASFAASPLLANSFDNVSLINALAVAFPRRSMAALSRFSSFHRNYDRRWSRKMLTPKNRKSRRVDMSRGLRQVLLELRGTASADLVFPSEAGTPLEMNNFYQRVFKPILTKAGLRSNSLPRPAPHVWQPTDSSRRIARLRARSDGSQLHSDHRRCLRSPNSGTEYCLRGSPRQPDLSATIRNTAATQLGFRFSGNSATAEE